MAPTAGKGETRLTDETRDADDVVVDDLVRRRGRAGRAGGEAMSGRLPRPKGMKAVKTKQVAKPYEPSERAAVLRQLEG